MEFLHTGGRVDDLEQQRGWLSIPAQRGYEWHGLGDMPVQNEHDPIPHYPAHDTTFLPAASDEPYYYNCDALAKYAGTTPTEREYNATVDSIRNFMAKLESLEREIGYAP